MKQLFMVSVMVFLSGAVCAQDGESFSEDSGPETGNLLIEITSSPFGRDGNSPLLNFGQFRARYALNDQLVPRLGIWFSIDDNYSGLSTPDNVVTESEMVFTPGVEYHFINENGFTTYAALDVVIWNRSILLESAKGSDVAGLAFVPTSDNPSASLNNRGYFGVGALGAVGADYHFPSGFYIGTEIGLYFLTGKTADVEVDGVLFQEGFKFFDAGVRTSHSFRIGFKLIK